MRPKNGPTRPYQFEILRYDPAAGAPPRFRAYALQPAGRMSVLEALLRIQAEHDPSLAFRYSCRGAVCGSCAMSINGKLNLACRVLLENLPETRVVLEPLPRFEILRDLVVDMEPFWKRYERVRPWLHAQIGQGKESRMSPAERERFDQYVNCILCGLCVAACPVSSLREGFAGPAALAKLYRFLADPRENRGSGALEQENGEHGVWGCRAIGRCIEVCPKDVRPTDGIAGAKRKLLVERLKGLAGRKPHEV